MKLCKPNLISLSANEKIFMNANRMGALKLLTGRSLSLFFSLRFEFMPSLRKNMKLWRPAIFASLWELAPSRNVLNNKSAIVVYTGDLFTGIDFDTISVCVQPRLFMKNADLSNRQVESQLVNSFKVYTDSIWKWRCRTHSWSLITTSNTQRNRSILCKFDENLPRAIFRHVNVFLTKFKGVCEPCIRAQQITVSLPPLHPRVRQWKAAASHFCARVQHGGNVT